VAQNEQEHLTQQQPTLRHFAGYFRPPPALPHLAGHFGQQLALPHLGSNGF